MMKFWLLAALAPAAVAGQSCVEVTQAECPALVGQQIEALPARTLNQDSMSPLLSAFGSGVPRDLLEKCQAEVRAFFCPALATFNFGDQTFYSQGSGCDVVARPAAATCQAAFQTCQKTKVDAQGMILAVDTLCPKFDKCGTVRCTTARPCPDGHYDAQPDACCAFCVKYALEGEVCSRFDTTKGETVTTRCAPDQQLDCVADGTSTDSRKVCKKRPQCPTGQEWDPLKGACVTTSCQAADACAAGEKCEEVQCFRAPCPVRCVATCGGPRATTCPAADDTCVDDKSDTCDPNNGGVDCNGVCVKCPIVDCARPPDGCRYVQDPAVMRCKGCGTLQCDPKPCDPPCSFGATCEHDADGNGKCTCPSTCTKELNVVCGSDGNFYNNPCLLRVQTCLTNGKVTLADDRTLCQTAAAGEVCYQFYEDGSKPFIQRRCQDGLECRDPQPDAVGFNSYKECMEPAPTDCSTVRCLAPRPCPDGHYDAQPDACCSSCVKYALEGEVCSRFDATNGETVTTKCAPDLDCVADGLSTDSRKVCKKRPDCSAVRCSEPACPDGQQAQRPPGECCATCQPLDCKPVACDMACAFGWAKDDRGCDTCACAENPCNVVDCADDATCKVVDGQAVCVRPAQCEPVTCKMYCRYGWAQDRNGCDTCACAANPCDSVRCAADTTCQVSDSGSAVCVPTEGCGTGGTADTLANSTVTCPDCTPYSDAKRKCLADASKLWSPEGCLCQDPSPSTPVAQPCALGFSVTLENISQGKLDERLRQSLLLALVRALAARRGISVSIASERAKGNGVEVAVTVQGLEREEAALVVSVYKDLVLAPSAEDVARLTHMLRLYLNDRDLLVAYTDVDASGCATKGSDDGSDLLSAAPAAASASGAVALALGAAAVAHLLR